MPTRFGHVDFILGTELWALDKDALLHYLWDRINNEQSTFILTLNPLMVMRFRNNPELADVLTSADVIVADGQGILWAYRKLFKQDISLIPGVDLAENIIKNAADRALPVVLLGGKEGIWEAASTKLTEKYNNLIIVGGHHGYFLPEKESEVIQTLSNPSVKVLITGMGFPKQEIFLVKHKEKFNGAILIGAGGSLDVYAGKIKRAPKLIRNLKIEWLWRMITEPKRFVQLFSLIKFVLLVNFRHPSLYRNEINDKIPHS